MEPTKWCEIHNDNRVFSHQSTSQGNLVNVYADEWTPNCYTVIPVKTGE